MDQTPNAVEWTSVFTVAGVAFSVALAIASAAIGNTILGKYNFKIRQYELFFDQKSTSFLVYIDYTSRAWATGDLDCLLGAEFEAIQRRARLFANASTQSAMSSLNYGLIVWAKASFEESGTPNIIELFSNVTTLMQKELFEKTRRRCFKKQK